MLKVGSVVVSNHGFRDPERTSERRELAAAAADSARALGARLVVLPAGFLAARDEAEALALARSVEARFRDAGLAVVGGVDVIEPGLTIKGLGPATDARVAAGTLPYFVFSGDGRDFASFRQRSTSQQNAALVPTSVSSEARVITVDGMRVALLSCGELFSPKLREAACAASPDLVLDVAHSGAGRTFQFILPKLARESGAWIMNAQHMPENNPHVAKWCIDPGGGNRSKTVPDARLGARARDASAFGLWAELALFEIPPRA